MTRQPAADRPLWIVAAIGAILGAYAMALVAGLPQRGTAFVVRAAGHAGDATAPAEPSPTAFAPAYWAVIPFVVLLAAIAVMPLLRVTQHWWEHNGNRFLVAGGLGALTLAYYALLHDGTVTGHWPAHHVVEPADGVIQFRLAWTVLAGAILEEYIPFIVLLFSLYTISGGIRIEGDLRADPLTNATFLAVGGLLASLIGTTGAAMLLIRPLLETNRERKHVQHTVVFFIFVVCNCGGALLPIGDPPLFLGYLRGVDFLWTLNLWPQWLLVNGMLIGIYAMLDHFVFHARESAEDLRRDVTITRPLQLRGVAINGCLLAGVVLCVALLAPTKPIPGTHWHPWMYLREAIQLGLVGLSLWFGSDTIRRENDFNYSAIVEVAALFSGIFICMQPALEILHVKGPALGMNRPMEFFWVTGVLSSVLDNAPTYVVFFETARTISSDGAPQMAGVAEPLLAAISLGAVFMGAMTYIGNGPNFMVKSIAEKSGVRMPSFFGYLLFYSVPILIPIFLLTSWKFFH
jgi:Na+/H+ antiporter NhaD/arsenite permease-like protein